ncbi:MAG: hypothetical protein ACP5F3_02560 [Candidatus Syntrophosphaera sp.]
MDMNTNVIPGESKYPTLNVISIILMILGIIMIVAGIIAGIVMLVNGSGFWAFLGSIIGGILSAVCLLAVSELIKLAVNVAADINQIRKK